MHDDIPGIPKTGKVEGQQSTGFIPNYSIIS